MRIQDLLDRNFRDFPDHTAVSVVGGGAWTYAELHGRIRRLAGALAARGIAPGDRVALLSRNGISFHDVYLSCAAIGAIAVPINPTLAAPEAEYILNHADPSLLIVDGPYGALASHAPAHVPVIDVDSPEFAGMLSYDDSDAATGRGGADDVCLMIYTSGTTGRPKGVCLTQHALVFNALTIALSQQLDHDDVFLSCTPLYHAASGTRVFTMLLDGQTQVILPTFEVDEFIRALSHHRVTTTVVVPTQMQRLLDSPVRTQEDLSALRLLVYGAAPTAFGIVERATKELDCGLHQGYGLTEAVTNLTALTAKDHRLGNPDLLGSCGRVVPGASVRLAGRDGAPIGPGEVGEIVVRSEKLMKGYWRDDAATDAAIVDGWLRTGDLARFGADGYMYIAGREKDMLISGGVNVYPSEIEGVLYGHPTVSEVAVVGSPHDEWGEVPIAFIVRSESDRSQTARSTDAADLKRWCEARLSRLKVPRSFEFVDALPKTSTGKVRKIDLQETARVLAAGRIPDPQPGRPDADREC